MRRGRNPRPRYRVAEIRYSAGESDTAICRAGEVHVLAGSLKMTDGHTTWSWTAGQFAMIPEGRFQLRGGDVSTTVVTVWDLELLLA